MREKRKKRVCHFTSAHDATDDRIFLKECKSLRKAGYEVYIVAKGENRVVDGIHIVGCGASKGRMNRFFCFAKKIYQTAKDLDCDVYQFHDPDLLPYGFKLKKRGKKVIFDSHEDVPAQILDKEWLPKYFRKIVSCVYRVYESYVVRRLDAVIAATPYIRDKFVKRTKLVIDINNYPMLDDIIFQEGEFEKRGRTVCYVGGIGKDRGEQLMLDAMKHVDGTLLIGGDHEKVEQCVGGTVKYLGQLNRTEVNDVYGKSIAGLITLLPKANYINSQPIKMFEYMAAGLPVIYSSFPMWKRIMEPIGAGIAVNPGCVEEVVEAINYLLNNPVVAQKMGRNGRNAVLEKYSWASEEKKLLELYEKLVYV